MHPVTREIIVGGARLTAADTFAALLPAAGAAPHRASDVFAGIDALMLPTAPTAYTTAQVLADPIELNSRLGTYTNFVNLLDLCGLARAGRDARRRHAVRHHAAGARRPATRCSPASAASSMPRPNCRSARSSLPQPPLAPLADDVRGGEIAIAVVGAHLSGMPLNGELQALGARFLEATDDRAGLPALCARGHHAAEARHAARRRRARARRSRSKSGRCRRQASANSSPRSRRRCRSARSGSPTAAACKGFLVEAAAVDGARDISASAAGARSWRRRRR